MGLWDLNVLERFVQRNSIKNCISKIDFLKYHITGDFASY